MSALFTKSQREKLLANGKLSREQDNFDPFPVVKLFTPWTSGTWLISELDIFDHDVAFGLCGLGMGCPELGYVYLPEIAELRGPGGLRIERDRYFTAQAPLSVYTKIASEKGYIHENIET